MKITIAMIPGDGIGPEVINQARKALDAIADTYNHVFLYKEVQMGACAIENSGNPLPEKTLEICRKADAILVGAIGDATFDNNIAAKITPVQGLLRLRKELGLFCNIRPIKTYEGLLHNSPLKREFISGTDILMYRELTGGAYFGIKELSEDGQNAFDGCAYSVEEIARVTHLAFKSAQKRRKKLTLVDKANVLETSRLWRKTVSEISKGYADVTLEYLFVDNAAIQLIVNPKQFDVILTENLFGDIIADEASVIAGSVGLLASASIGKKNGLFKPIHGHSSHLKGKDTANPLACIMSASIMLQHLGLHEEAFAIERAVEKSILLGITTEDIKGKNNYVASTSKVGDFIADYIANQEDSNLNFQNIHMGQSTII